MRCVEVVRDTLTADDPAHAADYKANADAYLAELAKLDAEVRAKAESLPKERRVLVTSHDAFGYFGAAYGFEVHGLQGVSTASETTTKDVQDLAVFLGTRRIPAVFGETSVPPKGLQAVLDAVKEKYGHEVRLVGGENALYSDALGEPGTPGESYVGMVRHNIDVIVGALGK
jgi:manganese/zinc/iron transport system substrate-binding protein